MSCKDCEDRLVTQQDIDAVIREHLASLDVSWPESERFGPPKGAIVELIQGIKLRLYMRAEKNANKHVSAFTAAARRVTGYDPNTSRVIDVDPVAPVVASNQDQNAALKTRIRRGQV